MARRNSNQRITKIKKDYIEELLKRAEAMNVEDACSIQPPGSDLVPYPDLNNLRLWTRDYLLSGMNKVYPVKFDESGETYYTVLIDGLPFFTKLTKQITASSGQTASFLNTFGSPTINNGIASNLDTNNYFTITDQSKIAAQNSTTNLYYNLPTGSYSTPAVLYKMQFSNVTFTLQATASNTIVLTNGSSSLTKTISDGYRFYFAAVYYYNSGSSIESRIYISSINDSTNRIRVGTYLLEDLTSPTGNIQSLIIGQSNQVVSGVTLDLSQSSSGNINFYNIVPGQSTSKPGLWLSNLIAPVSSSINGSWLRHNLVHDNTSDFSSFNSDTIGNYSYSFFQRGIIHRVAGSSHDDNDSFCQHWSPSALSCISHEAIIIPGTLLQATYTSYQTLVTPSDPDMQQYDETQSKDVEYMFIDNNDNIPLTTTQYNGRVVGDGWIYELEFIPNGNGSGNDYGDGDDPTADDGSNGGCVVGTIVYQDSSLGTTCTQEVNSCFQTTQSYFNPLVPNIPDNKPLDNDASFQQLNLSAVTCCNLSGAQIHGSYITKLVSTSNPEKWSGLSGTLSDGTTEEIYVGGVSSLPMTWDFYMGSATCGTYINRPDVIGDLSGFCGGVASTGVVAITEAIEEQQGVTLYLNIYDLKKQYESQGLPFPGGCGTDRFNIEISTTQCGQPGGYCTSFVIAENVDINSLGDISKLEDIVWSNSVN